MYIFLFCGFPLLVKILCTTVKLILTHAHYHPCNRYRALFEKKKRPGNEASHALEHCLFKRVFTVICFVFEILVQENFQLLVCGIL